MVLGKEEMGLGGHCDTQSINPPRSFKSLGHKMFRKEKKKKGSTSSCFTRNEEQCDAKKRNVEIKGIMGLELNSLF